MRLKKLLPFFLAVALLLAAVIPYLMPSGLSAGLAAGLPVKSDEPIKWVEFNVPYEAMEKALSYDVESYKTETHMDWIELLAYLGAKYGGDFSQYKSSDMEELTAKLKEGEYTAHLAKKMKYYNYYLRAYTAVLGGLVGEYEVQVKKEGSDELTWIKQYGLKAFNPIAEGYWYNDYDDFGNGRTYGYARKHLGHDLMISTGTPIVSVESGIVEALGWNQYGGWRIGIRSLDKTRYYYYAHLRKDQPYASNLYIGKAVKAGDVIGYSGQTGYSVKENVNNIDTPHLHFGMQLIFEEDKKDSPSQIWIDLYDITRLLSKHRVTVVKKEGAKDFTRVYDFREPEVTAGAKDGTVQTFQALQAVKASEVPEDSLAVPILMYHGLLKDTSMQNKFVISPTRFEDDLKYLQSKGYETITMTQLIDFVKKGKALPKKPIVISFDDGYYNNFLYAYPLLKQYDEKAVISIIGKCTDDFSLKDADHATYSHVTWDEINEMISSGHVEIQNHTYNMHTYDKGRKGSAQNPGESVEVYKSALDEDVGLLQQRMLQETGWVPNTFAYPFGYMSDGSTNLLKSMGFEATLSCTEGINYFPLDKTKRTEDSLFVLKRILRPPNMSSADFFTKHNIQ